MTPLPLFSKPSRVPTSCGKPSSSRIQALYSPRRHRGHGGFTEGSGFSVLLRVLRVSVVKQDVLPLQGHCLNRSRAALGTESSCRLDQYGEPAYMSGFKAKSLLRVLWKESVTVFCEKGLR